ncbi:hypothetical protein MHU86_18924 [Fragilaria crotonensis]|nr:hypothetical protein MHU86_18924 [Fragilaria crotonensis]
MSSFKTDDASAKVNCLCLGTGRFLRNVLVPVLNRAGFYPALIQTRGTSFLNYMCMMQRQQQRQDWDEKESSSSAVSLSSYYEVDTVFASGDVVTDRVACYGAFSLGNPETRAATWEFIASLEQHVLIIGVGVTEAGLVSAESGAMKDLMELLRAISKGNQKRTEKICILDMDNVADNGNVIQSHLQTIAIKEKDSGDSTMLDFLNNYVVCLNTMVDRITSSRPDDPNVPRAEPLPAKALVILDPHNNLPTAFRETKLEGVVVRSTREQLDADLGLKLRIANGTHTAVAHAMALQGILTTDVPGTESFRELWIESYLESLVQDQILAASPYGDEESTACWVDWKARLAHPYFGLSSFFITQNGAAKAGIRWSGTIVDLVSQHKPITVATVFAYAALIRWLVPQHHDGNGTFVGWLDGAPRLNEFTGGTVYADGMKYNLEEGWYEFKCASESHGQPFSEIWMGLPDKDPNAFCESIRDYLLTPSGGNLSAIADTKELDTLARGISLLVVRMVAGDTLRDIMAEIHLRRGVFVNGFSTDCSALVD